MFCLIASEVNRVAALDVRTPMHFPRSISGTAKLGPNAINGVDITRVFRRIAYTNGMARSRAVPVIPCPSGIRRFAAKSGEYPIATCAGTAPSPSISRTPKIS